MEQKKKKSTNRKSTNTKAKTSQKATKKKSFDWKNPKVLALLGIIALLVLGYFTLGWLVTLILVVGISMIIGIARLLDKTKSKTKQRKILNICFIVLLSIGILGCLAVGGFLVYVVKTAPNFNIEELNTKESTIVYDKDMNVITKLGTEMREKITYDDLPQVLVDAIIATEDSRFFQHNGFDAPRFLKASIYQAIGKSDAGGASTLSMQVVKNSFTSTEDEGIEGIIRKFTDIYLSIFKLEKNYTKEQIIEFYVNNHYLGGSAYGVEQASQAYFGKSVRDLNLSEAALLAGMFKSPNSYRPDTKPENAAKRRATVLYLMQRHGYITEEEANIANSIPVGSLVSPSSQINSEFQDYIDTVVEELDKKYDGLNPYVTPLLIYTNMDRTKQQGVNDVMNGVTYQWIDDVIQSGVAVVEVNSGKIAAIGAGRRIGDRADRVNAFNFATSMNRQPGSTAKPLFDYAPGIEYNNWSTYKIFIDEPYSYTNGKSINNWDGKFYGRMTMRDALVASRNIPALKAFQQVDNKKIASFVQSLGIRAEVENGRLHEAHSLGAFTGVTPLEMAAAYASFANGGYYYEPYAVNKIVYRDTNKTIEYSSEKKKVMSDATAYMITDMLTGVGVVNNKNVATKTGTTNYDAKTMEAHKLPGDAIRDSWVDGYSAKYAMSMWYGYNDIDPEYCSHLLAATVQKDQLYRALAKVIFTDTPEFKMPSSVVRVALDKSSDTPLLADSSTPADQIVYELFKAGNEPTEVSNRYKKVDNPTNFKATYDEKAKKVTLSWNKVTFNDAKDEYGPLGYNIYFNDQLLGFTEKTTYTISNPKTPYGTYKIIATFKNYTQNQSSGVTTKIEKPDEDEEKPTDEITSSLIISKTENLSLANINGSYSIVAGKDAVKVMEGSKNVTNSAIITCTIVDGDGKTINKTELDEIGVYTISYQVKYKDYTNTLKRTVTINT